MWCLAVIMSVKMKLKYQISNISLSHEYKLAQSIVKNRFLEITIFEPNKSVDHFRSKCPSEITWSESVFRQRIASYVHCQHRTCRSNWTRSRKNESLELRKFKTQLIWLQIQPKLLKIQPHPPPM